MWYDKTKNPTMLCHLALAQGIGRATALLFARKGYNVVVAARDLTKLQYVADDCEQASGRQGSSMAGEGLFLCQQGP